MVGQYDVIFIGNIKSFKNEKLYEIVSKINIKMAWIKGWDDGHIIQFNSLTKITDLSRKLKVNEYRSLDITIPYKVLGTMRSYIVKENHIDLN